MTDGPSARVPDFQVQGSLAERLARQSPNARRNKKASSGVGASRPRKAGTLVGMSACRYLALRAGLNPIENEQNDNNEESQPYPTARAITPMSTMRPARNYA